MAGQWLCEICFDALTPHRTEAWDGFELAVCEDCLAPPAGHGCWQALGPAPGGVEVIGDGGRQEYLVRFKHGATLHFRWHQPLRSRTVGGRNEPV